MNKLCCLQTAFIKARKPYWTLLCITTMKNISQTTEGYFISCCYQTHLFILYHIFLPWWCLLDTGFVGDKKKKEKKRLQRE